MSERVRRLLPPICLFLALVTLISGFALLAFGSPEPGMELHRARVAGDEQYGLYPTGTK